MTEDEAWNAGWEAAIASVARSIANSDLEPWTPTEILDFLENFTDGGSVRVEVPR